MKKIAYLLAATTLVTCTLNATPNPESQTSKWEKKEKYGLSGGWQKIQKKLPAEMQDSYKKTMEEVLADPEIKHLKATSEQANKAYRMAIQQKLTEKNPEIAKHVQKEMQKWKSGLKQK
jgi:hypothetical protein